MSVRVELSGQLAVFAGQPAIDCPAADSVSDLIERLVTDHPKLRDALFDDDGNFRRTTLVAINGEQVQDQSKTAAPDGSEVLLLMPMAGG